MHRTGKIVAINPFLNKGKIIDEHDQDILFDLLLAPEDLSTGLKVYFEIKMTALGLRAVDIKTVHQGK
ncbi:hypothetical protein [Pedobacter sp. Leaf194]|uniref:hypothetical protein n=1 Tax=Pedobacter sp. Leaf194 TaxID=1736297 RepID=UPI000703A72A|nr:hypothetical protein [Pedobacter sp. Leaf194]KQS36192.1 hypothetical protein ASG14_12225 [Pedobacter sp. Leaf194]